MTRDELRAFFAGCVLVGESAYSGLQPRSTKDLPQHCFTVADAMLAEHERRQGPQRCNHHIHGPLYCNRFRPCPDHDKASE